MADDFVKWDDLDLDFMFGENNWTDAEQDDILGSEQEWLSSDDHEIESFPQHTPTVNMDKLDTNNKENNNTLPKPRSRKLYKCPICDKEYSSTSGFRGHVVKKHNRPDIKGWLNFFISTLALHSEL